MSYRGDTYELIGEVGLGTVSEGGGTQPQFKGGDRYLMNNRKSNIPCMRQPNICI